jgi:hypothetical protein
MVRLMIKVAAVGGALVAACSSPPSAVPMPVENRYEVSCPEGWSRCPGRIHCGLMACEGDEDTCGLICSTGTTCELACKTDVCLMYCEPGSVCHANCPEGNCQVICRPGATCSCATGDCTTPDPCHFYAD